MKIDRMTAIIIYLLNHDVISASTLAEKFEVSKRTVMYFKAFNGIEFITINVMGIYYANINFSHV